MQTALKQAEFTLVGAGLPVEKPSGRDLPSARQLNARLHRYFVYTPLGGGQHAEAYERLLLDSMLGVSTLSTREDMVERA
jgi:glucose-6-phosphate 1-dehydrogenase